MISTLAIWCTRKLWNPHKIKSLPQGKISKTSCNNMSRIKKFKVADLNLVPYIFISHPSWMLQSIWENQPMKMIRQFNQTWVYLCSACDLALWKVPNHEWSTQGNSWGGGFVCADKYYFDCSWGSNNWPIIGAQQSPLSLRGVDQRSLCCV